MKLRSRVWFCSQYHCTVADCSVLIFSISYTLFILSCCLVLLHGAYTGVYRCWNEFLTFNWFTVLFGCEDWSNLKYTGSRWPKQCALSTHCVLLTTPMFLLRPICTPLLSTLVRCYCSPTLQCCCYSSPFQCHPDSLKPLLTAVCAACGEYTLWLWMYFAAALTLLLILCVPILKRNEVLFSQLNPGKELHR